MPRNDVTSKRVGKLASRQLRSKTTSKTAKSVAGSALVQVPRAVTLDELQRKRRTPKD